MERRTATKGRTRVTPTVLADLLEGPLALRLGDGDVEASRLVQPQRHEVEALREADGDALEELGLDAGLGELRGRHEARLELLGEHAEHGRLVQPEPHQALSELLPRRLLPLERSRQHRWRQDPIRDQLLPEFARHAPDSRTSRGLVYKEEWPLAPPTQVARPHTAPHMFTRRARR